MILVELQLQADTQISGTLDKHYSCKYIAQTLGGITLLPDVGCKGFCPVLIFLFQNSLLSSVTYWLQKRCT